MPALLLCTRPVRTHDGALFQRHFFRDERGVFATVKLDLTKLTPEQLAEYNAAAAQENSLPEGLLDPGPGPTYFPTVRLAFRFASLEDEEENIAFGLSCYPGSDCGEIAYASLIVRREHVLQFAL